MAVGALFLVLAHTLAGRRWTVVVAAALALLISNGSHPDWILMLAVLVFSLTCASRAADQPMLTLAMVAAGAAFLLQVKLTVGLLTVASVGLLVLTQRRRLQAAVVSTGSLMAVFTLLWLLAGQSMTGVPRWLRLGWEIVAGYNDAMGYSEQPNIPIVSLVVSAAVAAAAAGTVRSIGWVVRLGFAGAVLFFVKISLSLPDVLHMMPSYAGLVCLLVVLMGLQLPRPTMWAAAATVLYLCMILTFGSPSLAQRHVSPAAFTNVDNWDARRADRLASAREDLRKDLAIGTDILVALRGKEVSVDPWEISAVWAHDLDWRPLPVFQQYSAYTPTLDRANAEALLAEPERMVLRENVAYPGYNPLWVAPTYTLLLVCNFETVATDGEWSVLSRGPDRCGQERSVSRLRVEADEDVSLSRSATSLVAVRFEPDPRALVDRLLGISGIQRHRLKAKVDGVPYRVAEAQAHGPLILGAPEPEPVLFDIEPATTISFNRAGVLEIVEIPLSGRESG